jgi:hypothetical protein
MSENTRLGKRWLRFSLATFLFASLCIAGLIAGHQSGFRHGYQSGKQTRYNETQVVEAYSYVSLNWPDLLEEQDRLNTVESLTDLIHGTISPETWSATGNEIRDFPSSQSLVISAPGAVHLEIRELFKQLERFKDEQFAQQIPSDTGVTIARRAREVPIRPLSTCRAEPQPACRSMAREILSNCR